MNSKNKKNAKSIKGKGSEPQNFEIKKCWFSAISEDDPLEFCIQGLGPLVPLSKVLPVLENMGSDVITANYELDRERGYWVIRLKLGTESGDLSNDSGLQSNFINLFVAVLKHEYENDGLNQLISMPAIQLQDIALLRATVRYLLQICVPYSQQRIDSTLVSYPSVTGLLVRLFHIKFDPEYKASNSERLDVIHKLRLTIKDEMETISGRDDDQIMRSCLSVLLSMIRTNFFQSSPNHMIPKALSFKLRPAEIINIPQPAPEYETFVYSSRIEGVHLRGGRVSRGGLRWSDRKEDYRTEVLGLVKAQMVKNSVIVPVGAKGGFVIKQGGRECLAVRYSEFIAALLDITDNIKAGEVIPADLIRYDDDDPYLVVAADKGTALLSDVANSVAEAYEFWLGDAFASGGGNGYDHKKMGITARGAWQSTQRLFREVGIDCDQDPFTVLGIGDMSGDVFGNGMLLSKHICLVAAFNHQHIFIDPTPDAEVSYNERQRLFDKPHSSWEDYSPELISTGGGVFSRASKKVSLTNQIRSLCNLPPFVTSLTPDELIQKLLCAKVDLLWNGGIGTYIKGSDESNEEVADRANDSLRIDAHELGARIIVEGGNLGLTQAARVEFARNGGLITTDAIDNSGGVDCSDHEVNIKILLKQLQDEGVIDQEERNLLLEEMTEDVSTLVLQNNFQQSKMLSQSNHTSELFIDKHAQLINLLEQKGLLNRELEGLPDNSSISKMVKTRQGLTRPEISILLAYSKTYLFNKLADSDLIDDELIQSKLLAYFPQILREKYAKHILTHPLAKQILAAQITNQIANRMGSTFCNNLLGVKDTDAALWVKSHIAAREIFSTSELEQNIERLGFDVPNSLQMELLLKLHFPMERAAQWLLNHESSQFDTCSVIEKYRPWVEYVQQHLEDFLGENETDTYQNSIVELVEQGVSVELAKQLVSIDYLFNVLDISLIAEGSISEMAEVAKVYFNLNSELDLFWLRRYIACVPNYDHWYRKAKETLTHNIDLAVRQRALKHMTLPPNPNVIAALQNNEHYKQLMSEMRALPSHNLAAINVVIDQINPIG